MKETRSIAAPEKAFVLRPPVEFKKGLKIEAVDKRAPHLIRVATIAEVLPYQVKYYLFIKCFFYSIYFKIGMKLQTEISLNNSQYFT